jgi:hypothetical protein
VSVHGWGEEVDAVRCHCAMQRRAGEKDFYSYSFRHWDFLHLHCVGVSTRPMLEFRSSPSSLRYPRGLVNAFSSSENFFLFSMLLTANMSSLSGLSSMQRLVMFSKEKGSELWSGVPGCRTRTLK